MENAMTDTKDRYAVAVGNFEEVSQYLPSNYWVVATTTVGEDVVFTKPGETVCLIVGNDVAGWTLNDYVIPRLGSGMVFCKETTPEELSADLGRNQ
jgi:hypothetical protein